jgi:hypothetical protein
MATTKEVADHLKSNIDWQRFVNLCVSIGDQLNDAQWRFFKAVVFENSMEAYSDGSVEYVGEEGCDLLVTLNGQVVRVEMKYTEHALYTAKGKLPRANSQKITLMNSKGSNTHKSLPANYADFLLVVGVRAAALVSKSTLKQFININGDSIDASIPTNKMEFVFTPDTVTESTVTVLNLREELNEAVRRTLQKVL